MTLTLVYDTETTDFIQSSLPDDHPLQPFLVQLGAILFDDRIPRVAVSMIVKPYGYTIPDRAAAAHGITTEIATRLGIPAKVVIATFTNLRAIADRIVCHNLAFDQKVMAAQLARMGIVPAHPGPTMYHCTMDLAAPIVNLPPTAKMLAAGFNKPKAPKLEEAIEFFFHEKLVGAHDAMTDALACGRVFFELIDRGIVL
jgi:DNA polymerase-3 subunit epsilon